MASTDDKNDDVEEEEEGGGGEDTDDKENDDMEEEDERAIVRCGTTKGPIVMEFHRYWSPHGYDRAVALFERGFFDHTHFFRAVPKFLVQFGITYSDDPEVVELGNAETVPDDPQLDPPIPFEIGTISYAGSGPNSRTSQMFFSLTNHNSNFGTELWESPVGRVIEGIENVQQFYHAYGDGPPFGHGPAQGKIHKGRAYIDENFPLLDSFQECVTERIAPLAAHDEADDEPESSASASESVERKVKEDAAVKATPAAAQSQSLDWKVMGGGVLMFVVIAVFIRSVASGKKDPKKKK